MIPERIVDYILQHSDQEDPLLAALERETSLKVINSRMLSGHLQGSILRMLSKMMRPQRILELGTYTGYSAICLAGGLANGGELVTIEMNDELESIAIRYFQKAGLGEVIRMYIGDALEIVPQLAGTFDLVYIDADKKHYCAYYDVVFDIITPGGWIIADNTLWDGKVVDNKDFNDPQTEGIMAFNHQIAQDNRVEKVILPVRDGLTLIRKKTVGLD